MKIAVHLLTRVQGADKLKIGYFFVLELANSGSRFGALAAQIRGLQGWGVKNRNSKGGCKRLFAFVCVCPRLPSFASAFACVFASAFAAFVCVCLHLLAFAYAPLCPLHDTDQTVGEHR